eukprot:m.91464 g.91464  ORF g.91464 m.91464 type:complete len:88 (-) comp8871_c1_seq1:37-300(-)
MMVQRKNHFSKEVHETLVSFQEQPHIEYLEQMITREKHEGVLCVVSLVFLCHDDGAVEECEVLSLIEKLDSFSSMMWETTYTAVNIA